MAAAVSTLVTEAHGENVTNKSASDVKPAIYYLQMYLTIEDGFGYTLDNFTVVRIGNIFDSF